MREGVILCACDLPALSPKEHIRRQRRALRTCHVADLVMNGHGHRSRSHIHYLQGQMDTSPPDAARDTAAYMGHRALDNISHMTWVH